MSFFAKLLGRFLLPKDLDILSPRNIELLTALAYLGTPYLWGGDDPMAGFDCSGYVIECLQSAGLVPEGDWTADGLLNYGFVEPTKPKAGDLVFWLDGSGRAGHVEIVVAPGFTIGASGGGSTNVDLETAIRKNAFVKIRKVTLKGYRSMVLRRPY